MNRDPNPPMADVRVRDVATAGARRRAHRAADRKPRGAMGTARVHCDGVQRGAPAAAGGRAGPRPPNSQAPRLPSSTDPKETRR